jgi:hypothetical protein
MELSPSSRPSEFCAARIEAILDAIPPGRSEWLQTQKSQNSRVATVLSLSASDFGG